ncbi:MULTISPECIES: PA14 domain-containing protein [unclassified Mameliella]|uniref:PA14 domain-containing protein n=1 Tax=unclassified Mameliella TaxID=2630630 RepID=UPI00273F0224|nr:MULTISPECIES: PA14 domain-containing protein [unclassified Mameliella]
MPQSVSQYIFGNSLVNYTDTGAVHANVPIWMDLFADTAGLAYAVSGSYGFLRNFADWPEPYDQWGFPGVAGAWGSDQIAFADAVFDMILITPANFIQDLSPDTDYGGDTRSPFDAVIDLVDGMLADHPAAQLLIYEGWADMGPYAPEFPISTDALTQYHAYNMGAYHDWFLDLVDMVNSARPTADLALLPVGSILSDLMTGVLSSVPATAFYVDNAPHGTDTTYFLAAMITFQASYGQLPLLPATLPVAVHPDVLANFDAINAQIELALENAGFDVLAPAPDSPGYYDAEYFVLAEGITDLDEVDFNTPDAVATRIMIDFLDETGPIWPVGPEDHMAARYTRTVESPDGGIYGLRLTADDTARVYVDGTLVLDSADAERNDPIIAEVNLTPGTHLVEIRYMDIAQEASLEVAWDYRRPLPEVTDPLPPQEPIPTDRDSLEPGLIDPELVPPPDSGTPYLFAQSFDPPDPEPEPLAADAFVFDLAY